MIQEARPWLVDFHIAAALDSFFLSSSPWIVSGSFGVLESGFCPWVAPGVFCVLGPEFSLWVVPGVFCVLRSSPFSLGCFRCFVIFNVRVWSVSCVVGQGSLVSAFFFLVRPTPSAQCWTRGGPFRLFVCRFFLRPGDRPHSVLGHGLGNRAAKLRHGTVGFSCSFF